MIKNFSNFNENRTHKSASDCLMELFENKPLIEMETLPDEVGLYSLAGMKKYLKNKYSPLEIENAHYDLYNDGKNNIRPVNVKIGIWDRFVPYWYIGLTDEEVDRIRDIYETSTEKKKRVIDSGFIPTTTKDTSGWRNYLHNPVFVPSTTDTNTFPTGMTPSRLLEPEKPKKSLSSGERAERAPKRYKRYSYMPSRRKNRSDDQIDELLKKFNKNV